MTNRHMKRGSTWLTKIHANENYKEMSPHTSQNGSHQKIHNKCWKGCGEKGTLLHCWWECKLEKPSGKLYGGSLKKLKIETP